MDEPVVIRVSLTPSQFREINRRAQIGPFDGRARSEYIAGCVFCEPGAELLERVREIRDVGRARRRAEIVDDRAKRARKRGEPATASSPAVTPETGYSLPWQHSSSA